jgi:hypothetical protein
LAESLVVRRLRAGASRIREGVQSRWCSTLA